MRRIIDDEGRDYLEQLDTLREVALSGAEEKREEAHIAYEELRVKLLAHKRCETPDQTNVTKELEYGG